MRVRASACVLRRLGHPPALTLLALLCGVWVAVTATRAAARRLPPWAQAKKPSSGVAQSIGFYSEGCLQGGQALDAQAPGLRSVRRGRRRFYGHPNLISTLYQIGEEVAAEELKPALIGDLSQPRGGLMRFGHKSHQSGLDADIWFSPLLKAKSAVYGKKELLNPKVWSKRHEELLKIAAQQEAVERIFVHWRIKAHFCEQSPPPAWSRKLRPWFGHDKHFHIRLSCPPDSPNCEPQAPLPAGLGCDREHLTWFSAIETRARRRAEAEAPPVKLTAAQRAEKRAAREARERRSAQRLSRCLPLAP